VADDSADERVARLLLYVLVYDLKLAAGQMISDRRMIVALLARDRPPEELARALRYAHACGWVSAETNWFALTEEGYRVGLDPLAHQRPN
jgi:hypothetical protein